MGELSPDVSASEWAMIQQLWDALPKSEAGDGTVTKETYCDFNATIHKFLVPDVEEGLAKEQAALPLGLPSYTP